MPKRRDFLERLSQDDPNYEVCKRFYLKAWADSHGLVADTLGGLVSLSDYVERCVITIAQGAEAQVALADATSIPARCRELDGMATKSIRLFSKSLASQSRRLGKANTKAAIGEFSRRVKEIAARSKQRILEGAMIGEKAPSGRNDLPPTAASPSPEAASSAPSEGACNFDSEAQRIEAVALYTSAFECSGACLARSAKVDRADLSKWKKGLLSAVSDKKARIEKVLTNQVAPTPPRKRGRRS